MDLGSQCRCSWGGDLTEVDNRLGKASNTAVLGLGRCAFPWLSGNPWKSRYSMRWGGICSQDHCDGPIRKYIPWGNLTIHESDITFMGVNGPPP